MILSKQNKKIKMIQLLNTRKIFKKKISAQQTFFEQ